MAPRPTNGLAIASLISSILGLCCCIGAALGLVFGFVAKSQVEQSGGAQGGRELALAGIIIGGAGLGLWFMWLAVSMVMGFAPFFFMGI